MFLTGLGIFSSLSASPPEKGAITGRGGALRFFISELAVVPGMLPRDNDGATITEHKFPEESIVTVSCNQMNKPPSKFINVTFQNHLL